MADDDPKRPATPQPMPDLSDSALALVEKATSLLRKVIPSPATREIDRGDVGLFPPPPSPPNASGGDQPGGVGRARHPGDPRPPAPGAEQRPVPSVADILRDPRRYQPPPPPGRGHGRGPKR